MPDDRTDWRSAWEAVLKDHTPVRLAGRGRRFECTACRAVFALRKSNGKQPRIVFRREGRWIEGVLPCRR